MFVFLRDLRATVIAAVALPLSIIPTFWAMSAMDFSLNLVSLLAITIVTGILVDDAIVEIENIVRHIKMGKSAYRASIEAADEIGLAVIAITLTIVAVFTPVSFMAASQVSTSNSSASLWPQPFCSRFCRASHHAAACRLLHAQSPSRRAGGPPVRAYGRLVHWSAVHRYKAVALGLMIFMGSVGSFYLLPSGFLPQKIAAACCSASSCPQARASKTHARSPKTSRGV